MTRALFQLKIKMLGVGSLAPPQLLGGRGGDWVYLQMSSVLYHVYLLTGLKWAVKRLCAVNKEESGRRGAARPKVDVVDPG